MIDAATRVSEASRDVFRLEVRKFFEDLFRRETRRQEIENIDDADPQPANARTTAALFGIHRDPIRNFRHGELPGARPADE